MDDDLGHHGPKDRDRTGPGAVPRRPTGDYTVSLRDEIASEVGHMDHLLNVQTADAILALVKAHLTSDEAVARAASAWINTDGREDMRVAIHAAILAALGEGE